MAGPVPGFRWSWHRSPAGHARTPWPRPARIAGGPGCHQRGPRRGPSCRPRRPARAGRAGPAWRPPRRRALFALVPGHGGQGARRAGRHRGQVAVQRRVERLGIDMAEDPGESTDTGERIHRVHESRRPPRTASVSCEQPATHSATAAGESCPAAVNAQIASASTYTSRCRRPSGDRRSGTRASHSRRQPRDSSAARTPASSPAGTSISEDSSTGTGFPKVVRGWHLRSWKAVPACQTGH